ncbi:MAG: L,D-transpeptidase [Ignavibacteria bacterium]|nr:L,D-transpeptidase [Ignavibacteria bacterium]
MFRNSVYYLGGIVIFVFGMFIYGIVSNWREVELNDVLKEKKLPTGFQPKLVINKIDYKLHLYADTILVKTYDVVFGGNPKYDKRDSEDRYTPKGSYFICDKKITTGLGKTLVLNYPTIHDAEYGLKQNIISNKEYLLIESAFQNQSIPPMNSKLGGNIKIHGNGKFDLILRNLPFILNWTNGSIAVNNREIEELYDACPVGTEVIIY